MQQIRLNGKQTQKSSWLPCIARLGLVLSWLPCTTALSKPQSRGDKLLSTWQAAKTKLCVCRLNPLTLPSLLRPFLSFWFYSLCSHLLAQPEILILPSKLKQKTLYA